MEGSRRFEIGMELIGSTEWPDLREAHSEENGNIDNAQDDSMDSDSNGSSFVGGKGEVEFCKLSIFVVATARSIHLYQHNADGASVSSSNNNSVESCPMLALPISSEVLKLIDEEMRLHYDSDDIETTASVTCTENKNEKHRKANTSSEDKKHSNCKGETKSCSSSKLVSQHTLPLHYQNNQDAHSSQNHSSNKGTNLKHAQLQQCISNILPSIHPALTYLIPSALVKSPISTKSYFQRNINKHQNNGYRNKDNSTIHHESRFKNGDKRQPPPNSMDMILLAIPHQHQQHKNFIAMAQQYGLQLSSSSLSPSTITENTERLTMLSNVMNEVNGEGMILDPASIIKVMPISKVLFWSDDNAESNSSKEPPTTKSVKPTTKITSAHADLSTVQFDYSSSSSKATVPYSLNSYPKLNNLLEIPLCPVCLHRIEPSRLGLTEPKHHQRCSNQCAFLNNDNHSAHNEYSTNNTSNSNDHYNQGFCKNMQYLSPWTYPSYCEACHIIEERLILSGAHPFRRQLSTAFSSRYSNDSGDRMTTAVVAVATGASDLLVNNSNDNQDNSNRTNQKEQRPPSQLQCYKCGMKETLWVCLTCGIVGCGRYSQAHAEQHFTECTHPFSLELATQRIWDYTTSAFIQRGDLLTCPLMQSLLGAVNRMAYYSASLNHDVSHDGDDINNGNVQCGYNNNHIPHDRLLYHNGDETSPKKATMIGEEYEALLQSALEDQAQHYEGEISRLRAELTAQDIDKGKMTIEEVKEVERLQRVIAELRLEVERISHNLLEVQAQEAGHRAKSNALLREQGVAKELLNTIREEALREQKTGKLQVEDLEQQVADLSANLQMRQQFSQDEVLNKAQILRTTGNNTGSQRIGRKKGFRKMFRK